MRKLVLGLLIVLSLVVVTQATAVPYQIRDLGTINGVDTLVTGINDLGQIIGYGYSSHGLIWNPDGTEIEVGRVQSPWYSDVYHINNLGQVVGSTIVQYPMGYAHAWIWSADTGITFLGELPGYEYSRCAGINNAGVAVGLCYKADLNMTRRAFKWSKSTGMESLGSVSSSACAVNDLGQVVGNCKPIAAALPKACVWETDGTVKFLGTIGGQYSSAAAINNRGQIVGDARYGESDWAHAFLWTPESGMVDLDTRPVGSNSGARDINDYGVVVGQISIIPTTVDAFVWRKDSGKAILPGLPKADYTCATGINSRGVIAGYSRPILTTGRSAFHAVVWEPIPLVVSIDIKPGDLDNRINLKSKGVVPVALLTTPDLDVAVVDAKSIYLAGAVPERLYVEDVDVDGDMDLLLHFRVQDLQLTTGSVEAVLSAMTIDGDPIEGRDSLNIVNAAK